MTDLRDNSDGKAPGGARRGYASPRLQVNGAMQALTAAGTRA